MVIFYLWCKNRQQPASRRGLMSRIRVRMFIKVLKRRFRAVLHVFSNQKHNLTHKCWKECCIFANEKLTGQPFWNPHLAECRTLNATYF